MVYTVAYGALCLLVLLAYFVRASAKRVMRIHKYEERRSREGRGAAGQRAGRGALLDDVTLLVTDGEGRPAEHPPSQLQSESAAAQAAEASHPEARASWVSRILFSWMSPLVRLGTRRPLEVEDLSPLRAQLRAEVSSDRFAAAWAAEVQRPRPSLLRALRKAFGLQFYLAALPLLLQNTFQYIPPLLLREMVGEGGKGNRALGKIPVHTCCIPGQIVFVRDEDAGVWKGYLLAFGACGRLRSRPLGKHSAVAQHC